MAYEFGAMILSLISSIVLSAGLYLTVKIQKTTRKASVIWTLILIGFSSLLIYQVAEVVEYADELAGEPHHGTLHHYFEEIVGMTTKDFAEGFAHTMPTAAAVIFVCLGYVLRHSIIAPI